MTTTVLDATELLRRRNDALARLEQLRAELRRVAYQVEAGESAAAARFDELELEIAAQERVLRSAGLAGERVNEIAADQRATERAAAARAEADRRAAAERDYRAALVARDQVAGPELDALIDQVVGYVRRCVETGRRVDAAGAAAGRPAEGVRSWLDTPNRAVRRLRGAIYDELQRIDGALALASVREAPDAAPIPSLARPAPAASSIRMEPDHKPHVVLDIVGPNIRTTESAILPSPLPTRTVGAEIGR